MDYFIKIQKTASTSFKLWYEEITTDKEITFLPHGYLYELNLDPKEASRNPYIHSTKQTINLHKRFTIPNNSAYITIVRNPFDLLVSYYHYGKQGWANCNSIHGFKSWEKFLNSYIDPNFKWHIPPMKRSLFSFAQDKEGNNLASHYFRYETLEHDLTNYFFPNKPTKPLPKMPHTRQSKRKHKSYNVYYTEEQVDKLKEIWKADLKYFNYDFDSPQR